MNYSKLIFCNEMLSYNCVYPIDMEQISYQILYTTCEILKERFMYMLEMYMPSERYLNQMETGDDLIYKPLSHGYH